jgi:hypothetical protein
VVTNSLPVQQSPDDPLRDLARLNALHQVFRKFLGQSYDVDVLDVVIATRIAHLKCKEDRPPWLFIVGGSGDAKTETLRAMEKGAGGIFVGSITSQASLLSGVGQKDRDKTASGGLLLQWPRQCFLLIIDFTTTLSLNPHARAGVLDGFRWMYDGRWPRATGGGGGRQDHWEGRIGMVGGVTTAIDRASDVISQLGSRWAQIRLDDSPARRSDAGRNAIRNVTRVSEESMSKDLAGAVWSFLGDLPENRDITLSEDEEEKILQLSDVVTRVRSAVDFSHSGWQVVDVHALEMPTRFPKTLVQLFRGLLYMGHTRAEAMRMIRRIARDSMPPTRRKVLEDVAAHPNAKASEVRERLNVPDFSARRELEALTALGALIATDQSVVQLGTTYKLLRYRLGSGIQIPW